MICGVDLGGFRRLCAKADLARVSWAGLRSPFKDVDVGEGVGVCFSAESGSPSWQVSIYHRSAF